MRTAHHSFCVLGLLFIIVLPTPVSADLIQDSADIRSSAAPKSVGGWVQDLGKGLSGTMTEASFPIHLIPHPELPARFELSLNIFSDETYNPQTSESLGGFTWPWTYAHLDPAPTTGPLDTTLTFEIPDTAIRHTFNPEHAYRLSVGLSSASGGGQFGVYGSLKDSYATGSTSAPGLADMAFTLVGVDRAATIETPPVPPVSSVLFLPGIKGSRLYREDPDCGGCERLLWEPYSNESVYDLMLSPTGKSLYDDVYVKDAGIISEILGTHFYTSLFEQLDAAKQRDTYGPAWDWKPIAYDWRLSLTDLVTNGVHENGRVYYARATSTPYIEQTLRALAATSPTGKVTIVAHSNGGLVAKALMRELGAAETAALIDDVVMVGVPQIGAPQTLASMLFGYGEALPFNQCADNLIIGWLCGMFVDRATARSFAQNAPMGYHLLPSHTYVRFGATADHPIARFSADELYASEQERYGTTLDTIEEMYDYLLARDGGRTSPPPADTHTPSVLLEPLISYARSIHESLDFWTPPQGVTVHQIAGWGLPTISGIEFYEEPAILGLFGSPVPRYRPLFSQDGDGVVPQYSAIPSSGGFFRRYWMDLPSDNAASGATVAHSTLLEHEALREAIDAILKDAPLPQELSTQYPSGHHGRRWRLFFLHSPLTLELYDQHGNHVGEGSDGVFTSTIPDVLYGEFGEVKYLIAPADIPYTLTLTGKDHGTFSLDIQELAGGQILTSTTIAQAPSTPSTIATMEVGPSVEIETLLLDHQGDGVVDATVPTVPGSLTLYTGSAPPPAAPAEPNESVEPSAPSISSQAATSASSSGGRAVLPRTDEEPQVPQAADGSTGATTTTPVLAPTPGATTTPKLPTSVVDDQRTREEAVAVPNSNLSASAAVAAENIFWWLWRRILEGVYSLIRFLTT